MPTGNVMNIQTTGASAVTAGADGLQPGVGASRQMAAHDLPAVEKYKSEIKRAAAQEDVPSSVLAAIMSRETRGGVAIQNTRGYGYDGHGFGLMQIDDRYHTIKGGAYSYDNILQGAGVLKWMIQQVRSMHPNWSGDQILKGGICAYNCGQNKVQSYENMDMSTTGRDYSNDVVARAQYYAQQGI